MAESASTVLPDELMIEILFRVDLSNPLQLRCVCKLWNSLILDPHFMKMHLRRSLTEARDLHNKAKEHYIALKSQIVGNNPIMPQEEEEEEDEDDYDDEAAEDGDEVEEEQVDGDDDEKEDEVEEEVKEEDEDAEEEDKEKRLLINIVPRLDVILVNVDSQLNVLETINAQLDDMLVKTIRANLLDQLDRVKCLKSFLQVYIESPTSSSSLLKCCS